MSSYFPLEVTLYYFVFLQVHLELAKYNDMGRFTNYECQMDCAMFHLEQAAACADLLALITMAEIYLQLPHEILASATVQVYKIKDKVSVRLGVLLILLDGC